MSTPVVSPVSRGLKIFGREPVVWLASLQTVLAVLVALPGVREVVTPGIAAWVITVTSALFMVLEAWSVRPVTVAVLSGAIRTTLTAFVLFGLAVPEPTQHAIVAFGTMVLGFLTANSATPNVDPDPTFTRALESSRSDVHRH